MNLPDDHPCRGCLGAGGTEHLCIVASYGFQEQCPCSDCIVKVTCTRGCKPRNDLAWSIKETDKCDYDN